MTWHIEFRPVNRPALEPWELAQWDQLQASGDLGRCGSWLLAHGCEFRVDLGDGWLHVTPGDEDTEMMTVWCERCGVEDELPDPYKGGPWPSLKEAALHLELIGWRFRASSNGMLCRSCVLEASHGSPGI